MRRAVVLGSGGIVGVAWLQGVVQALKDAGVDVTDADALVGTSAGSIVSAELTTEPRPDAPRPAPPSGDVMRGAGVAPEGLREIFMSWGSMELPDEKVIARIGELARSGGADCEGLVAMYEARLGDAEWPDRDLRVVTCDTHTGARKVFDRESGVRLARAVAASTAVPGLFPPVVIGEGVFMDGGVYSTTHADLLAGDFDRVLVAMPTNELTGRGLGRLAERCLEQEVARLEQAGARVETLAPLEKHREAYGKGLMDITHAASAKQAGSDQVADDLERVRALWGA